ncbi:MAG: class I SAM-dependent methyltransferase [Microthrixaceae bacterium]
MRAGRPSKTAEQNALFRALETTSSRAAAPIVDPLAFAFLSPPLRWVAMLGRSRLAHRLVVGFIDRRWPGVRSSVVARTRLIDEIVQETAPCTGQTVVLGAGFDSRPYRLSCLSDGPVFEVDHPATQRRKRAKLDQAQVVHRDVRFAGTDFQSGGLDEALEAAGFDLQQQSTLFIWEGVTNYLTDDAVDATLRWCAGAAAGSHLVFTYVDRRVLHDPTQYHGAGRVLATSRRAGEAVTFGMDPEEVSAYLSERGFVLLTDTGASSYREAYYGAAARHIHGHEFYRVAHAHIPPVMAR